MSNQGHVLDLLPAYALGSLDGEEVSQVAGHLADCSMCRAELAAFEAVTAQLALSAPDTEPPLQLKSQILERIPSQAGEPLTTPQPPWWQRLTALFHQAAPAWGLAGLVLVILLVVSNLWWWQRMNREPLTVASGMQVVAMAGTDAAPDAVGTLVISEDGEYGTLVVDGLPALAEAQQYQLWLIRDGQRTSGGVFSVNSEGYGALWIESPESLSSYPAFGITIEPAGGSSGPTGDRVLGTTS